MLYKVRTVIGVIMAHLRSSGSRPAQNVERYIRFAELRPFEKTPFYLSHHPDEFVQARNYAEFDLLEERFLAQNLRNNCADLGRLWILILNIRDVLDRNIEGDFAELGVWRGNTAAVLAYYSKGRRVYLFDTFEGFDTRDLIGIDAARKIEFSNTTVDLVRDNVADAFGSCRYVKGRFPESVSAEHADARYAVVSLDCDLQEPMAAALDFFYPRLSEGGVMFIHDYDNAYWPGIRIAVDAFCQTHRLYPIRMPDKSGSIIVRKTSV